MAKKIKGNIKLQIPAGGATPAPPVGSALGQHGVNIMDFCKKFNAETAKRKGETVPVIITVYADKSFDFITKTPPVSELIKKKIGLAKGSGKAGSVSAGSIKWSDVEEIAKAKMVDLNAFDIEAAKKIVAGSARSMGLTVVGDDKS
jgi:large subunit ribosomal protein L11